MIRPSTLAQWLRISIYASAFVPLVIFSQFISPFHFGKVVVFRSLVELMFVGYLLLIWQDRSYLPKRNPLFWTILGFVVAFTITTATSILPYLSFWGTLERMGGLWTFWHYVIYFVILTSVFRTREQWLKLVKIMAWVAIASALYGFGQKTSSSLIIGSGNRERIFGTIGNAALFAGYEIVAVFLALTFFLRREATQGEKWLFGTTAALGTLAIIMTSVRGSLLGLGVGFLILSSLYFIKFHSKNAKRVFMGLITAAAILLVVILTPIKDASFIKESRFLARLTTTSFESYTAKTRFWAWRAGLKGWVSSPKTVLFGWGPEAFNIPFSHHFDPRFFQGIGSETFFDRAHNMFVEVLVTMGLLGFVSYVAIFFVALRRLWRAVQESGPDQVYGMGFIALIVAYMIHNSFIFDTSANLLVFFTVLGFIVHAFYTGKESATESRMVRVNSGLYAAAAGIGIALALVLIYTTNIRAVKANYATTRAIVQGWQDNFSEAIVKYRESLSYDVAGKYEYRHRFAQYVLEYFAGKSVTSEAAEVINFAISEVQKNVDENKPDYLPELYLSRLYITLGKDNAQSPYNDEALKHSLRALEISPTFVRTYYEIGQAYLNKKDFDTALEYFAKAAELNPEVGLSYWYVAAIEFQRGNVAAGVKAVDQAIARNYGFSETDYLRLIAPLLQIGDYKRLVWLYEQLVYVAPNKAAYWAALASAYAHVGKIDEAVNAARKAVSIDPSYLAEAKGFVESLGRQF